MPATGSKLIEDIQRGVLEIQPNILVQKVDEVKVGGSHYKEDPAEILTSEPTSGFSASLCDLTSNSVEPTGYELERRSDVAGWNAIREGILTAVTETAAMVHNQPCLKCENAASLRCQRCGPLGFFCQHCFQQFHTNLNVFHVAEKWEEDHYVPVNDCERHIDIRYNHQCSTKRKILIQCMDEYGMIHKLHFTCCNCEPLAITLARAQLWPASPHNPRYAFSFAVLDWAESLMVECQVALKDFCNALKLLCPFHLLKERDVYSAMINTFEEYRFLKHKVRHLDYLLKDLDSGNVCPACPQGKGKYVYAMDALFGLPRKKSAGVSYREPLHGDLFFSYQSTVDQYVAEYNQSKDDLNEWNDFLAGNMLRSAGRYKALDETAVFGFSCRHEFPKKFISLKHGERLAYPVWMLERINELHSSDEVQIYVLYDIACSVFNHLKSHGRSDILDNIHLSLPTFHSYGHKMSCQVVFSPRRCEGIGLSDGETMERLWSYLRRFGRMTKEMRPTHRIDVLTSALVFYGIKTKEKLASLLLLRWERSLKTKLVAQETLSQLMPNSFEETLSIVKQWLADETASCHHGTTAFSAKPVQWKIEYFHNLQVYYELRQQLASGNTETSNSTQLIWLETKLHEMEKKHSLLHRWLPSDKEFKECEGFVHSSKNEQLLLQVWKAGQRRMFLLNLKKKYADGQKIAKKISSQISKETKIIKSLLNQIHACQPLDESSSGYITLSEALDPSAIQSRLQIYGTWHTIAEGKKRDAIDAYLSYCRSVEEIKMLKDEAENVITYYEQRKTAVVNELESNAAIDSFTRGAKALLHLMLKKLNYHLEQSYEIVKVMEYQLDVPDFIDIDDNSDDDGTSSNEDD